MTSTIKPAVKVTRAEFRPATSKDIEETKGSWLWRTATYPLTAVSVGFCKVLGTWEIFSNKNNVLAWDTPKLQQLGEGVSALRDRLFVNLGFEGYRDQIYLKTLFSFIAGDRYFVDDKVIMEAFFKDHRKENVWNGTPSLDRFISLIKRMFPEENFTKDDFMFSCSKEQTDKYHLLLQGLIEKNKEQFSLTIEKIASDTIEKWFETSKKTGQSINITEATRIYAAQIVAKRIFNVDYPDKDLSEAMDFLSNYVVKEQAKTLTPQDEYQLTITFEVLKKVVNKALESNHFDPQGKLTLAQKKAMVIVLIFAGQETTASLLNYFIWRLARAPKIQEDIYSSIEKGEATNSINTIHNYFINSIHQFTPAYVVNRQLSQETCLECTINGNQKKYIMHKGQTVTARISKLADDTPFTSNDFNDWFAFGNAVHACPGKKLAQSEIEIFIAKLSKYLISTKQNKEIEIVGIVTSRLKEDIYIDLKERNPAANLL